jgi:hypothetical protein
MLVTNAPAYHAGGGDTVGRKVCKNRPDGVEKGDFERRPKIYLRLWRTNDAETFDVTTFDITTFNLTTFDVMTFDRTTF